LFVIPHFLLYFVGKKDKKKKKEKKKKKKRKKKEVGKELI
jgi:hypothetical protein